MTLKRLGMAGRKGGSQSLSICQNLSVGPPIASKSSPSYQTSHVSVCHSVCCSTDFYDLYLIKEKSQNCQEALYQTFLLKELYQYFKKCFKYILLRVKISKINNCFGQKSKNNEHKCILKATLLIAFENKITV